MDHEGVDHEGKGGVSEAEAHALNECFNQLTANLLVLHRRAMRETQERGTVDNEVRDGIFALMRDAFVEDENPAKVFNYIMYLIDVVSTAQRMDEVVEKEINELAHVLNGFALAVGLAPVIEGAPGATPAATPVQPEDADGTDTQR